MNQVAATNRLDQRFAELKAKGRTGLIPFITAGYPEPDSFVSLMHQLVKSGADVIELGVPFSDPSSDGSTVQQAGERMIARGVTLQRVLEWVKTFRQTDQHTPIVLMGYLNPVEIYGYEAFATDAVDAGVDGVLLVDCPIEEKQTAAPLRQAGLRQIWLAAPTTSPERLNLLCEAAEGFLYYVSVAGVTGSHALSVDDIATRVGGIREQASAPVAVGFGIRRAEQAVAISAFADAVVIGSALVEALANGHTTEAIVQAADNFLAPIRAALQA